MKTSTLITEQLFTKTIEAIQKQYKKDCENAKSLQEVFPDANILLYDNNTLSDALITLLREVTDDKDNWIEYFIYDLDFGTENYRLKVTDDKGENIPLSTTKDLYNLLTRKK